LFLHVGQAGRGEKGGGGIATRNAGKVDAVDSRAGGAAELVGVRVVVGGHDARAVVVVPRRVGPAAAAQRDAEVVHQHRVIADGIVAQRQGLRWGGCGEIERKILVRIGAAHGSDGGVDDVGAGDV